MTFWKHSSWNDFKTLSPEFKEIEHFLPIEQSSPPDLSFAEDFHSSYKDQSYKYFFYGLARVLKPQICVELGVLEGYSLFPTAYALKENGIGKIYGYDLFDSYAYRHEKYEKALSRVSELQLNPFIDLHKQDVSNIHLEYDAVDLLHIDLSNTGETYLEMFDKWSSKVKKAFLFEGGSKKRDNVEWMLKYKKPPIAKAIEHIKRNFNEWDIVTLEGFPSLTVIYKKN
jgi:predicted O-methyltransferase YrrM